MSLVLAPNLRLLGLRLLAGAGAVAVLAILVWQAISAGGIPNPVAAKASPYVATLDIGVLVFREGLECILVLAALTASMVGRNRWHRQPVAVGAGVGFFATLLTWVIIVGIVNDLSESFPALHVQAATGLLAIVVLLIVMNWFFHKLYWSGWISIHNNRKRSLQSGATRGELSQKRLLWGLGLLGFSCLYREGFEVVLFLQSYRLKLGGEVVLQGVLLGLFFTGIVAALTFFAHQRLPYRRMLVLTGVLLGVVLLVMVGEEAQEMQLARWIPTTEIGWLTNVIPSWMGLWFAISPTVETLAAQALAAVLVVGSYWLARTPANNTQCQAECSVETSSGESGETGQCTPFCVSATICEPLHRDKSEKR